MARLREFDQEALLACATDLFWARGYEATSISDIASASGVGNGSLYAAFGSKLGLFLAVFERYCAARVGVVRDVMLAPTDSGRDAVDLFFRVIVDDCVSHAPSWGCLMLNSVAELGKTHPEVLAMSARAVAEMGDLVEQRLLAAEKRGELTSASADLHALASQVVLVSQGLINLSLLDGSRDRLDQIAEVSLRMLPLAA
ncbi:MAG: TetR/AcrR family transcriptional regulator [Lacisediminihabitans sp.]